MTETQKEKTEEKKVWDQLRPNNSNKKEKNIAESGRNGVAEADYSILKIFFIIFLTSAFSFLFSYSLYAWEAIYSVFIGIFFVSFAVLSSLFLKAAVLHAAMSLITACALVAPLFFFMEIPLIFTGILTLICFVLISLGVISARREINNSLRISFIKFSDKIITKVFLLIAIVLAVVYGWNFKAENIIEKNFTDGIIRFASPVLNQYFPGFVPEIKLNDFFKILAEQNIAREKVIDFFIMPERPKEELIAKTALVLYKNFEKNLMADLDLEKSFKDNFGEVIRNKLAGYIETVPEDVFSKTVMFIIFVFFYTILKLFVWLIMAVSFFIFQTLLVFKFATVYFEQRSKEIVLLK